MAGESSLMSSLNAQEVAKSSPLPNLGEAYSGVSILEVLVGAKNYNSYLVSLIRANLKSSQKVVDFGAGLGTFADEVRSFARTVSCVEPDPELQKVLKSKGYEVVSSVSDYPDSSLEMVYTFNVLEHIEDDEASIAQIFTALKKEGVLLVYVPAMEILWSGLDDAVHHYRRYGYKELRNKLTAAGFEVKKIQFADSLGFFASIAYRWFGDKQARLNPRSVRVYDGWLFPISRRLDYLTHRFMGKNLWAVAVKR